MVSIQDRLRALRDVQDVYGGFLVSIQGDLLARDLPAMFSVELMNDVAARVALLGDACRDCGEILTECVLRYNEHKLHLRSTPVGVLGVITGTGVNAPALRMAMNLVVRHAQAEFAAAPRPEHEPFDRPSSPPGSTRPVRMYRGRPVQD
jgi:hypothetical protein